MSQESLEAARRACMLWLDSDATVIRRRLRKYLDGVNTWDSSERDARAVLEKWIDDAFVAGFHAGVNWSGK